MLETNDSLNQWRLIQSKLNKLFVHDLKNPISALSANLSFLETALARESEEVRGAVSDSILAAAMLLRFAENLNTIAMLESDEECSRSELQLETFVLVTVNRNKKFAESAGIRLELVEPLASAPLVCQYRYAEVALENLILSAIRHSPQGGEVDVSSSVSADKAIISVCDHGRHVSEENATRLFTREAQSEAKKQTGIRYGRGVGLYAADLAAKALNGQLTIGTRDGMTEFALVLPLRV
ncbi:MAG: sensor histidine kinase [Proteobacteria bacterium]|nr:sensor histidine kinase [Pseudomonadota bacterium]